MVKQILDDGSGLMMFGCVTIHDFNLHRRHHRLQVVPRENIFKQEFLMPTSDIELLLAESYTFVCARKYLLHI